MVNFSHVLLPIDSADCPKHQISFHFIRICHFGHTYSLQLEKLKKLSKFATYIIYKSPTTAELITRSIYTGNWIIDESKTVTLPNIFIRTSDSYFHEKLLHINAMIEHYSLPSLFLTRKVNGLKEILKSTDNGDTLLLIGPYTPLYILLINLKIEALRTFIHAFWLPNRLIV